MQHAGARTLREYDEPISAPPRRLRLVEPGEVAERRTITITGNPTPARRRPSAASQRIVAQPDRVALWAVLLGLFMVLMAVVTASF